MSDYEKFNDKYELRGGDLYHRNCEQRPSYNGRMVGQALSDNGYKSLFVDLKVYKQHRVVWLLTFGEWPVDEIDHIDGDRTNNRIENLRDVTRCENQRNQKIPKNNTSGFIGVSWHKRDKLWIAQIYDNDNGNIYKTFKALSDAVQCRSEMEIELGYHQNHGRTA